MARVHTGNTCAVLAVQEYAQLFAGMAPVLPSVIIHLGQGTTIALSVALAMVNTPDIERSSSLIRYGSCAPSPLVVYTNFLKFMHAMLTRKRSFPPQCPHETIRVPVRV